MALSYRTRRTLANALGRAAREPRQLLALLVILVYGAASLGMIVVLLVAPLPAPLRATFAALIPGGVQGQLDRVRGGLTIALLLLACTAAFQNPLLQFGPAEIDLVFPAPIPSWRLLLDRLLLNHLRALAAAYFFWGLTLAPLLRLAGRELWPSGAWGMLALLCLFATIDQGCAAALLWLEGRGRTRWLIRAGLIGVAALAGLLLAAALTRLLSGGWGWFAALLQRAGAGGVGTLLLPIGLAADVLLPGDGAASPFVPLAALIGLDLATAAAVIAIGRRHLRELALSPLGRSAPLMAVLAHSRLHPVRLARALWHPERPLDQLAVAGARAFGQRASALAWARLLELQRNGLSTGLALGALGLAPLLIVLRSPTYSLGGVVTAAIFSASLGTQLFNDLADHLTRADLELALPAPRWRLLGASLLMRLPVYWAGGLILLLGVGLLQHGARWSDLAAIALWYPLLLLPLLALRGALMFLYPAAALPGRRDPVQAVVVLLVNGLLTMGLLLLSLAPLGVLLALSRLFGIGLGWLWPVAYLTSGLLSAAALGALAWAYGRYEPGEGI